MNEMYLVSISEFSISINMLFSSSLHEPRKRELYVGQYGSGKETEEVRQVLIDSSVPCVEIADESCFYGPKIDVQVWMQLEESSALATNQVDFAVPGRFGLTFIKQPKSNGNAYLNPSCSIGTHERFMDLIEHFAGNFPYLAGTQTSKHLPIGDKYNDYAKCLNYKFRYSRAPGYSGWEDWKEIRTLKSKSSLHVDCMGKRFAEHTVSSERKHGGGDLRNLHYLRLR